MKKTFFIKGMNCNSCAEKIENELKDKVNSISVSFSKGEAVIDFNPNKIKEDKIKNIIKKLGYEANEIQYLSKHNKIKTNLSDKIGWTLFIIITLLLLILLYYFFLGNIIPTINIPEIGEQTSLILLFIAGLLTGFHCISMCGGFVVSYTAKNAINGHKGYTQHFIWGASKVLSYAIIGGIFGLIGGIFAFSIGLRGTIAILAGIFMIFYALSMFGLKFFRKFQFNPKFLTKFTYNASKNAKGPFITGLLNGLFIACGPLQAMYLYAAGTESFIKGATSLAVFGFGTLPVMIVFGSFATAISHKTTQKILKLSAIIVLVLGLIMLNRGLTILGSPYSYESIKSKIINPSLSDSNTNNAIITNKGYQEVNMNVDGTGYSPNSFVLKKGVPVKWNINVNELTACNQELISREYNIDLKLKQGLNTVEFTPDKTGIIPFSCGMGMLRGSFIVTETGLASNEEIKASKPQSSGGSCNMGAGGSCGGSCSGGCGCK